MCDRQLRYALLVKAERRTRVHFEADIAAFGRTPQIDAGKRQAKRSVSAYAPVMRLRIELDALESGVDARVPRGIAIVDGIARDGSRERRCPITCTRMSTPATRR